MEELRKIRWEREAAQISDTDIRITDNWTYLENSSASRRLLELLIKHHGGEYVDI